MADLVESLMRIPGAVAVARVGRETAPGGGEVEYLLYYRGAIEATDLRGLGFEGEVSEPCEWGRLMNGGGSLTVEGRSVGLLYRDLDAVEHWVAQAGEGRYEVDGVDSWVAGMPSYVLAGELATAEVLAGELSRPEFPAPLRDSASRGWQRTAVHVLAIAEDVAARGDVVGCAGLLAKAAVAAAQARHAEWGEWALSERAIVRRPASVEPNRSSRAWAIGPSTLSARCRGSGSRSGWPEFCSPARVSHAAHRQRRAQRSPRWFATGGRLTVRR